MGSLRHASPQCRPRDGSDRSLQSDDEHKATARRALRGLFLRVLSRLSPPTAMAPAARSGAFFLVSHAARQPARRSRKLTRRKPITAHHARPRGGLPSTFAVTDTPNREPSPDGEVTGRM